jgi:hypothetical protein
VGLGVGVDEPIPASAGLVVGLGVGLLDIDDSVGVGLGDGLGLGVSAALGVSVGVAVGVGVGVTLDGVRVDGVEVGEGLGLCCAATRDERLKTIAQIIIVAPIYRSMTSPPDGLVLCAIQCIKIGLCRLAPVMVFSSYPKELRLPALAVRTSTSLSFATGQKVS